MVEVLNCVFFTRRRVYLLLQLTKFEGTMALADDVDGFAVSQISNADNIIWLWFAMRKTGERWVIRDIDTADGSKALTRVREFLEGHPNAKLAPRPRQ
jgi:hypothetical protein